MKIGDLVRVIGVPESPVPDVLDDFEIETRMVFDGQLPRSLTI
jgi:hypothetical protein